jgi:hypothetical protein
MWSLGFQSAQGIAYGSRLMCFSKTRTHGKVTTAKPNTWHHMVHLDSVSMYVYVYIYIIIYITTYMSENVAWTWKSLVPNESKWCIHRSYGFSLPETGRTSSIAHPAILVSAGILASSWALRSPTNETALRLGLKQATRETHLETSRNHPK